MKYLLPILLFIVMPLQAFSYERGLWLQAPAFTSTTYMDVEVIHESAEPTEVTTSTVTAPVATTTDLYIESVATSSDQLAQMVSTTQALGMSQVYLRLPAMYTEETDELLGGGVGDHENFLAAMSAFIEADIDVFAWIVNGRRLMEDQWQDGTSADFQWVDLCSKEEREAQAAWVTSILTQYPDLTGIELDYIRYSDWELADADKMACVTQTVESVSGAVRGMGDEYVLSAAVFPLSYSYAGWTEVVESQSGPASSSSSSTAVSADTEIVWDGDIPDWFTDWYKEKSDNYFITQPALDNQTGLFAELTQSEYVEGVVYAPQFFHYQQDPVDWLRRDLIDVAHIMQYSSNPDIWYPEAAAWEELAPDIADRVMMGLGWLDSESDWDDWTHDPQATAEAIDYTETISNLAGTALFTLGTYPELDQALIGEVEQYVTKVKEEEVSPPTPETDLVIDEELYIDSSASTTEYATVPATTTDQVIAVEVIVSTSSAASSSLTLLQAAPTTSDVVQSTEIKSGQPEESTEPESKPIESIVVPPSAFYRLIVSPLPPEVQSAMNALDTESVTEADVLKVSEE